MCPGWNPAFFRWDRGWDYGTSRMGSHLGLWNIPHGIPLGIMEHPAWDPTWDYGTFHIGSHTGLWNIPHGIPPGIMEHPAWDPTWGYGTSPMGFCQLNLGSRLKFLIASHLGKHIPGRIKPRIPPIPLGILPQISDSFPRGKSYPRQDCIWDPANPSLDPA